MGSLRRLIERLSTDTDEHSQQYYDIKFRIIDKLWQEIQSLNYSIWEASDNPATVGYNHDEYIGMEEMVQEQLIALSIKRQSQRSGKGFASRNTVDNQVLVLPKITTPKFDANG